MDSTAKTQFHNNKDDSESETRLLIAEKLFLDNIYVLVICAIKCFNYFAGTVKVQLVIAYQLGKKYLDFLVKILSQKFSWLKNIPKHNSAISS